MKKSIFLFLCLALTSILPAAEFGKVSIKKITEGVYLFQTNRYGDVGMCGNSVLIVTDDGAIVFDTGGIPETAKTVISEIRKITTKPVRYVVNSHWHWDHWGGNEAYFSAFPKVSIVSTEKTLELMKEVEPRWNDEGLKTQLPAYVESLEKKLQTARDSHASQSEIQELEELLNADRNFLIQKTALKKTYPDLTFSNVKEMKLGSTEVRIYQARGITAGDAYLFLPKEKILITGDIMLDPYPYAIGGTFPADWLKTLEQFASLRPSWIIPGHGQPQEGTSFLENYVSLFREIQNKVQDSKAAGATKQQTVETLGKQADSFAAKLKISDPALIREFKAYFLDILVARSFDELDHPLTDL